MPQIVPVILCGGSGTRLWPRSRASKPKPFLPLIGEGSLFEATLDRCSGGDFSSATIVTGAAHLGHVRAQGEGRNLSIIVEPAARNTAPAIALAAARLPHDQIMLICPSDHHIADTKAFAAAATTAAKLAREGWLVAFGIEATRAETGFGYIRRGEPLAGDARRIAQFVEKPDRARAEKYLADGGYFWNGGIFCFTAGRYLKELSRTRPAMAQAVQIAVAHGHVDEECFHPDGNAFAAIVGDSIDYAVMEEAEDAAVVPVSMGWSDIGNWPSLQEARGGGLDGNVTRGPAELVNCRDVMTDSDGPRVSVVGMEDVIVVVDGDEVLVTSHAGAQKVGQLAGAKNQ
ncbi:sugar phosphate nucleotidyltransferase [Qipengyuania sp. DY56-A-20]|uniref:Sugar phosphate nucleotidyltransferase n=1 Tax=Qipengyuania benthica TaxID=3067651 RepID=A0ABT9H556_9SPHN|nr:sugar phosphate nucleotidyltransferase [Qipengyuania sp. DY56-A-20]MDP4538015.1 sugar phosphate nucleotidyltransferase [Qipengyuania sp. DY56-A-20]